MGTVYAVFEVAKGSTWMVPETGNRVDKGRGAAAGLVAAPIRSLFSFSLILKVDTIIVIY
jgi:hypothetical protein